MLLSVGFSVAFVGTTVTVVSCMCLKYNLGKGRKHKVGAEILKVDVKEEFMPPLSARIPELNSPNKWDKYVSILGDDKNIFMIS